MCFRLIRFWDSYWKRTREKGVILVATAIMLPVLLAATGMAFDIGRLYMEKAKMQNMADAAVLAGVAELKGEKLFKKDSSRLMATIPIGALPCELEADQQLRVKADASADVYLLKNSGDSYFQLENAGAKSQIYTLRNSDTDDDSHTYYYEVIVEKTYPLTFGRIVYGKDITVRAGAVCMFKMIDEQSIYTYAYAMENWSRLSFEELMRVDPLLRLKVDREAFTNLAHVFLGKDATWLNQNIGTDKPANQVLFGHYTEKEVNGEIVTNYKPYQGSVPGKTADKKFMDWLQGNENGVGDFDSTKRYLFSDYASTHEDGFKLTIKVQNNQVTSVKVQVNPGDAANGSGALEINVP